MPHATNWGLNPSLSQLRLANFKRSDIKRARTGSPNLAVRTNRGPNCLDKVRSRDNKVESRSNLKDTSTVHSVNIKMKTV